MELTGKISSLEIINDIQEAYTPLATTYQEGDDVRVAFRLYSGDAKTPISFDDLPLPSDLRTMLANAYFQGDTVKVSLNIEIEKNNLKND